MTDFDHAFESEVSEAAEQSDATWFRWLGRVQDLLGLDSLDGDQDKDGYSLDDAYDHFAARHTSRFYAERVRDTQAHALAESEAA